MATLTKPQLAELFAAPPQRRYAGVQASSIYLTMRDGARIASDLLLPAGRAPGARLPTLIVMARYWRSMELHIPAPPNKAPIGPREMIFDDLIPRGFAIVVVDARGTGASTGVSRYPWSPEELADYGEVAAWTAAQPWCSGRIGAFGISYEGATALRLAAVGGPAVRAVAPQEIEHDVYPDIAMPGGIFNMAFIRAWSESNRKLDAGRPSSLFPWSARLLVRGARPVDADLKDRAILALALREHQANTDVYAAMARITYRDDLFGDTGATLDDFSVMAHQGAIERGGAAIFSWASWLDGASAEVALRTFHTLSNPQLVVIGAWKHEMSAHGSPYQRPGARLSPAQREQWAALAQFFDQTLAHDRPPQGKRLFYYTLGAEEWRAAERFPPPGVAPQDWYFQDGRGLAPTPPAAAAADTYVVDFAATTGTANRWHTQMARPVVYRDRARQDRRLLTYTSAPLEQDLEIVGYPVVTLYVASSVDDGAFYAYLEDVDARGVVRYLTEGQLRGIHRKLADAPPVYRTGMPYRSFRRADAAPLPRGEPVELTFGLQPIAALIRRGHRIRVAIAGADHDTFVRIPAEGTPIWQVLRGPGHASRISLPIHSAHS